MSYLHPTADVNSNGEDRDTLVGERLRRAQDNYDNWGRPVPGLDDYNPFQSWRRITDDIIHYRPFDSLPQEERDAIRYRRRQNFERSRVPWLVTDLTTLLTAYDDVDDLLKTKKLIQDYGLTPAAKAARALKKGENPFRNEKLQGWDEACDGPQLPRERKLTIPGFGGLNFLAALGLGALGALFPGWRLAALLLQAAQTTDSLFGVGIQLGPALGYVMEAFFRGVANVNGPIGQFDNKFEQLKAARAMRDANKALAAAGHAHGDDALTSLTGFYYASDADLVPQLVIDQDDYPSVSDVFENPWALGKEGFDAARLAASLPYNLGAALANNLLGDALQGMSEMLGGSGADQGIGTAPDNETAALMKLVENSICPTYQCEGELAMDVLNLSHPDSRKIPGETEPLSQRDMAKNLDLKTELPRGLDPQGQTPVPS